MYYIPENVNTNCGIYRIVTKASGKVYIGSSKDLAKRKKKHFKDLALGKHYNPHLQYSWNKEEDKSVFEFQAFVFCKEEDLIAIEQNCLKFMKPQYNVSKIAGGGRIWGDTHPMLGKTGDKSPSFGKPGNFTGKKHSSESKSKMGRFGENHNCSKLTEKDVLEILSSSGSCRALAKQYGVTPATISYIKTGKKWKHLNKREF